MAWLDSFFKMSDPTLMGPARFLSPPAETAQMNMQSADPMQGMGAMQRFGYLKQNNPEALMALAAGMMNGDLAGGLQTAGAEMSAHRKQAMARQEEAQKQNKTKQWLIQQKGLSEEEADMALSNPAILNEYLKKPERQNLMNVGDGLIYDPNSGEWITAPKGAGGNPEYGLTPVYGKDAQGNLVLGQLSKDGTFQQTDLPEGFGLTPGVDRIDLGTAWGITDRSGQVVSTIPKDIAGAEAQKEVGKAAGEAQAAAPGDVQAAENALGLIDSIRNDPNRQRGTGFSAVLNAVPGTRGYDFANKVQQAKSGAFLSAIEQMRGMGALSNAEGQTATAAVTRLNTATSEEEFMAALSDYERIVRQGYERAAGRLPAGAAVRPPAEAVADPLGIRN